jgi:hypothetical protein
MIDLHSVIAFSHIGKCTELAMTHEIDRVLEENIINYSTVGTYVRMFVLSTKESDIPIILELEGDFSSDDRIALVLSEEPFLSVRQIPKKVIMSKSTVYRHLTHIMNWKLRRLKWAPHNLTESEKMNRVRRVLELLELRQSIRH